MATIILENAGETILLEGEAAEKYLAKKQAEKRESDKEYQTHATNRTYAGKVLSARDARNANSNKATEYENSRTKSREEELVDKYGDVAPAKLKEKAKENHDRAINKINAVAKSTEDEFQKQIKTYKTNVGNVIYEDLPLTNNPNKAYADDAKARHERRHGPKNEDCGDLEV